MTERGLRIDHQVNLAGLTTIGIGGPAERFLAPQSTAQLEEAVELLRQGAERYFILGNGSNLLVSDHGFAGTVLSLRLLRELQFSLPSDHEMIISEQEVAGLEKVHLRVSAGLNNGRLLRKLVRLGVGGMEFLTGIPGTIGGSVAMNAGGFFENLSRHNLEIHYYDRQLFPRYKRHSEISYGYRFSEFRGLLVVSVEVDLPVVGREAVEEKVRSLDDYRLSTQPQGVRTMGSTFKNPPGMYAGELIEKVRLKGHRRGGAQFSEVHANFIVNLGGATCEDVLFLMCEAKRRVLDSFGVELEPEVIYLGPAEEAVVYLYGQDYPFAY